MPLTDTARPSKLADKQKSEIQRLGINGEGVRDLAKVFKVSPATISALETKRTETIKALAMTIARAETKFDSLPFLNKWPSGVSLTSFGGSQTA